MSDFDLRAIALLQEWTPAWSRPAIDLVSLLGGPTGWMVVILLAFWWSGSRLGVRVALVTTAGAVANLLLKWWLLSPRPFFASDAVTALAASDGLGMPSGHAQGAAAQWGALWRWGSAWWLSAAALVMIGGTGLCRIYYGLHTPLQVLVGWALGLATLAVAIRVEPRLVRWGTAVGGAGAALRLSGLVAVLLAVGLALEARAAATGFPPEWEQRYLAAAERTGASDPQFRPVDRAELARSLGGLAGAICVALYYARSSPFEVRGWRRRGLTTGVGGIILLPAIWLLAKSADLLGGLASVVLVPCLLWVLVVAVPRGVERFS